MSLKIWLPMLGNLNNQGLLQGAITPMATSVTANSDGKIGSCMSCDGTADSNIRIPPVLKHTDNFTIACWVKFNSTSNQCLFSQRVAVNTLGFTIFYLNGNGIRFDEGNSVTASNIITSNTWYHITCCRDDTTTYIYLNGVLVATGTRSTTAASNVNTNYAFIGGSQNTSDGSTAQPSNNVLNGYLNDYRIYDHCLSAAEVHEIAQGLVAHYKLDRLNNNLFTGSQSFSGAWVNASSWTTSAEKYKNFVVKQRSDTWSGITQLISCTQGDTFTISFYGKVELGGVIMSILTNNFGTSDGLTLLDGNFSSVGSVFWVKTTDDGTQWKRYWGTVRIDSSEVNTLQWRIENSEANKIFWICGLKMERGSVCTPWTPAYGEEGYERIPDSSGYGYHGSLYQPENITVTASPLRYDRCLNFGTALSSVNCGQAGYVSDALTVNFWFKIDGVPDNKIAFISCIDTYGWAIKSNGTALRFVFATTSGSSFEVLNTTPTANICNNQWHMITALYDRLAAKIRMYIDGVLDTEVSGGGALIQYSQSAPTWIAGEATASKTVPDLGITGYISDVRIYCTPLSAADILQLYKTSAKIDKPGNLHVYTLEESEKISVKKNGIVSAAEFVESDILATLKYDKNIYVEPDGSMWVRVYHHNDPNTNGKFSTANSFTIGCYIDEHRWFNVNLCDYLDKWEILIIQKLTSTSSEVKYRWVQTTNPMSATYEDTVSTNIILNTSTGYTAPAYFGLWCGQHSSWLHTHGSATTSWWGAIGPWADYNGGTPSFDGSNKVTTGCTDLYVRIDNVTLTTADKTQFKKNGLVISHEFIEM